MLKQRGGPADPDHTMLLFAAIVLIGWVVVCAAVMVLCVAAGRLDAEIAMGPDEAVERELPLSLAY